VIDLETGDQPIYNEDRSVAVVLNGEIYNFPQLRDDLRSRGHRFSTAGDTEVIVHLYEELGPSFITRLNGMFAIALWDEKRRMLLLARDRVGKKPLYYHQSNGSLSFASELEALTTDPALSRQLDPSSLDTYLAYGYVQAPHTIFRNVLKLPPAHTLEWERGNAKVNRYWRLDYSPDLDGGLSTLEGELRSRVSAAVKRRMIADVPLGAFLSGGVDSSIVVAEMAAQATKPVKTFSIGFGSEDYNELPKARIVAREFGTDHHEFMVDPDAVRLLPTIVRHYGEPFADSSAIPSFYLAELTRQHVTVALNGDGGDESFAGYLRYAANSATAWVDAVPEAVRARVAAFAARHIDARDRRDARVYARRYLTTLGDDAWERYAAHVGIFDRAERTALLRPDVVDAIEPGRAASVIRDPWRSATGTTRLDAMLQTDVETYLPGDLLTKIDIATMAHSLEARSPLLDHELMEFAARLPDRRKVRLGSKKWILRHAYRDRLPAQILNGPKRGFAVPLGEWFRGDLRGSVHDILLDEATGDGLLEKTAVETLVREHLGGQRDRSAQIWALMCLESWRRQQPGSRASQLS
jgi:asparagine synthase (glutamine-hydrolysing)